MFGKILFIIALMGSLCALEAKINFSDSCIKKIEDEKIYFHEDRLVFNEEGSFLVSDNEDIALSGVKQDFDGFYIENCHLESNLLELKQLVFQNDSAIWSNNDKIYLDEGKLEMIDGGFFLTSDRGLLISLTGLLKDELGYFVSVTLDQISFYYAANENSVDVTIKGDSSGGDISGEYSYEKEDGSVHGGVELGARVDADGNVEPHGSFSGGVRW